MKKLVKYFLLAFALCTSLTLILTAAGNDTKPKHLTAEYNYRIVDEKDLKTKPNQAKPDADSNLYTVINGSGEEYMLDSSVITNVKPILTLTNDKERKRIERSDCSGVVKINKLCPVCNKEMMTVSVLHEVNPKCKHGIFSYANYCVEDDVYVPFVFFTRCGCL